MKRGYVRLWRKIEDSWLWKDPEKLKAWLDLVLIAQGRPGKDRGSVEASLNYLSNRWKWGRCKVQRFLLKLEEDKLIKTTHRMEAKPIHQPIQKPIQGPIHLSRHITILKYDTYNPAINFTDTPTDTVADTVADTKLIKSNTVELSLKKIMSIWNSHESLRKCVRASEKIRKAVKARKKTHSEEQLSIAFFRYHQVLGDTSGKYWLTYRWSLAQFLERESGDTVDSFLGDDWEKNYLSLNRRKDNTAGRDWMIGMSQKEYLATCERKGLEP